MTPPINIDGTQITGATIDGTDVQTITVDGTEVFSASRPVPNSGLLRYTFDDADTVSGTTIDFFGNNDGTINGATTGVSGANETYTTNEAYDFDGTDDTVTLSTTPLPDTSPFTVAMWVNPDIDYTQSSAEQARLFEPANGRVELQYGLNSAGDLQLRLFDNQSYVIAGAKELPAGSWLFVGGRFDGNTADVFVENADILGTQTGVGWQFGTNKKLTVGADGRPKEHFNGDIDDVSLYDKALSNQEISDLYNTGSI